MSSPSFEAPTLEALAALLPAYDFEAFIAQGGMGAVYKARQRSLDRDVAIKILPRELGADPEFRQSFTTEARAMARLNHPNLIGVYDSGDVDGMPYIVMEFVNGKSLYHSAYNLAVEPIQAVTIVKGICDGLAHAHENGVIHRDIKPANILLTPKTEPKIGDFGLAHAGDGPGMMMGTPGYTAPEVMSHPEMADRRSDIFSVGVILYELLAGHQPPLEGPIPPPSSVCGCDVTLDQICFKAMHVNALIRYQDAHEMSADLDTWMRRAQAGLLNPVVEPAQRPVVIAPRPVVVTAPAKSSGGMIGKVVVAAVVLGGGFFFYQQHANSEAEAKKQEALNREASERRATQEEEESKKKAAADAARRTADADPYKNEKPLDSLERLKPQLAAGKREKMPNGSFVQRGSYTMLIPTAMSWQEATAFAQSCGGYLATTLSDEDLQAFTGLLKQAPGVTRLWLGAGRSGREWSLADGSPWTATTTPVGVGDFVAVDEQSLLRAMDGQERLPFVIQWRADGTNPGSVEESLARVASTTAKGEPVYPPGTWSYEGRRTLAVYDSCTEAEAWQLAKSSGGHLVVTSSKDETGWLSEKTAKLQAPKGLWIGAVKKGETWGWITRETWDSPAWAPGNPVGGGTGAVILPGQGWHNVDPGIKADGFIVEWSKDRESAPKGGAMEEAPASSGSGDADSSTSSTGGSAEPPAEVTGAALELRNKAKTLIGDLETKRQKDLSNNSGTFKWDLDTWHRTLSKTEQQRWKPEVENLKGKVEGNRVPSTVGDSIRMSEDMAKIAKRCAEKQAGIDAEFKTKAGGIRDAYLKNLEKGQASAASSDAPGYKAAAAEAKSLDAWLSALGIDKTTSSTDTGSSSSTVSVSSKDGDPIVGHWTFQEGIKVIIGADHSVDNGRSKGQWKLTSGSKKDRQYEFTWPNNGWDKLEMSGEGRVLDGTNGASVRSGGIKNDPDPEHPWSSDPIVGEWMFNGHEHIKISGDGTASYPSQNGTWTLTSGDKQKRTYQIWWNNGWDRMAMSTDGNRLEGTNNNGASKAVREGK